MAASKGEADFWSTAFPAPTSPAYTQRRLLSTCILGTFLFAFVFLAVSSLDGDRFKWLGAWNFRSGQEPVSYPWLQLQAPPANKTVSPQEDEDEDLSASRHSVKAHYGEYVWHDKLSNWDIEAAEGRLIFIGDVHGMVDSLRDLLSSIDYSASKDQLVFVGDLVAKSSLADSLDTLTYIRKLQNVRSVRGNHDQHVISWRAWMEAARSQVDDDAELDEWDMLATKRKHSDLPAYPDGWEWGGEHFMIAKSLSQEDWQWYKTLPLSIYVPDLETFVVHAGMLSTLAPIKDFKLPVSTSAEYLKALNSHSNDTLTSLSQEVFLPSPAQAKSLQQDLQTAVLMQIQNRDPWTLIDMRGVRHGGSEPTRKTKGDKWFKLWNSDMEDCEGKSCINQNIIYGHWAGQGLTLKDHSFGLDTGCVYGKSLTALIINDTSTSSRGKNRKKVKTVEIHGHEANVVSVSCNT